MELFHLFFKSGVYGSVIIVITLLLRHFLKQAPRRYLCILWVLVALRLVVPFHFETSWSLQPDYQQPQTVISVAPPPVTELPETQLPQTPVPELPQEQPHSGVEVQVRLDPEQLVPVIWLAVGLCLMVYGLVSYGCLRYRVRDAVKGREGVMESDRIAGGFLLGYFKPEIYIPTNLPEQDRGFIVAHEEAHRARGDHWWKFMGFLCCCIHWYNPLVWVGYWLMCRDIEIACDEQVIRNMDMEERRAYSYALLNCGKRLSGFLVCPVAFGEVSLKQRIKNVLSYRRSGLWITGVTVVLLIFVAVCFLTTPETHPPEIPDPTVQEEVVQTQPTTEPATEPTTEPTTEPITEATIEPATEPVTELVTEPVTQPATEPPTEPPTQPATEAVTKPKPTEPKPTEPKPTQPPVTQPTTQPPKEDGVTVIAEEKWDGGPIRWKVTSDGTFTITGNRSIQGAWEYPWKKYAEVITKIVVDDTIVSIPDYAFSDMTKVTEVYLGKKINDIGMSAFSGCTALKSVSIPAQVGEIQESTFYGCKSLRTVTFAKYCQVEKIGAYAFANSGLTSFTWPDSLVEIYSTTFQNCTSMTYYQTHSGIFRGTSLFEGDKNISVNGLESAEIYGNVGYYFEDCKNLKTVLISGNCTELNSGMFEDCTGLTRVEINAPITEFPSHIFEGCSSLRSFTIPDTVRVIGCHTFNGTGITQITIPASVEEISWAVFKNTPLREIVFLGDAPHFVNGNVFSDLTITAYYPGDNPTWTEDVLKNYGGNVTWIPA